MSGKLSMGALTAIAVAIGVAMSVSDGSGEARAVVTGDVGTGVAVAAAAVVADTTGAEVWAHIQEEDYRKSWDLWPGTAELYEGQQPHGMKLTTYVNEVAAEALNAGRTVLPEGSIVIKENYTPNDDLAAVTVMYKQDGYNPNFNDWFFSKHLPSGELDTAPNGMALEGRVPGCQNCHMSVAAQDYLFTDRPDAQ